MSITSLYHNYSALECATNYSRLADDINLVEEPTEDETIWETYGEEYFWPEILSNPGGFWNREYKIYHCLYSDWVARIPGLYWNDNSGRYRGMAANEIDSTLGFKTVYRPVGKSMMVTGGVGTNMLPPDNLGRRVGSVCLSGNISGAIPVLVYPEVYSNIKDLKNKVFTLRAKWVRMDATWSDRFRNASKVPRGYFEIKNKEQLEFGSERHGQPIFHPYTIMEHEKNGLPYFDFFYLSCSEKNYRERTKSFCEQYLTKFNGAKYLVEPNPNEPIFGADYNSPLDFRQRGQTLMNLMNERIEDLLKGDAITDEVYQSLAKSLHSNKDLRTISTHIIGHANWMADTSFASNLATFINLLSGKEKIPEVVSYMVNQLGVNILQPENN